MADRTVVRWGEPRQLHGPLIRCLGLAEVVADEPVGEQPAAVPPEQHEFDQDGARCAGAA